MAVDIKDLTLIADNLAEDLSFYRDKKIFLTGGTGFFGKWLLESFIFLNSNHDLNVTLTILSRSPHKFSVAYPHLANYKYFTFIQGDVSDFPDMAEDFDLIIHAATDASAELNKSNPELMRSTIMDGAKRICEFADKVNCKRILYTSSGAAYGPQPENLTHIPETFVDNPLFNHNDAYASAKLESEKFFIDNVSCEVVIARCFAFAGPYLPLDGSYAFGNFINDVIHQKDIVIKGDGTAVRSYLYAADLVTWLMRILSKGKDKDIYNVGSSREFTIKQLAEQSTKGIVGVIVQKNPGAITSRYVPCVDKAKLELRLNENYSISDMVDQTISFYSKSI